MSPLVVAALGGLLGAASQRVTGIGFALIALPFFAHALGPLRAVVLAAGTGAALCLFLTVVLRARIDWERALRLMPWAVGGAVPGFWLASALPESVLAVIIGSSLLLALAVSAVASRSSRASVALSLPVAGLASGAAGAISGTPGVPMLLYAQSVRWGGRAFAASTQPVYFLIGLTVATAQVVSTGRWTGGLPPGLVVAVLVAVLAGASVSAVLERVVSSGAAMAAARVLAAAGAVQLIVTTML